MAEWLYEAGIGENRAALIEHGEILEALLELEDAGPRLGTVASARLAEILVPGRTGRVQFDGEEALLEGFPRGLSQGAILTVRIVREAIPEPGRAKLAKAVAAEGEPPTTGPDLFTRLQASGVPVRRCHAHEPDRLEAAGWSELLQEARDGEIAFAGGALRMSPTPAMTLFDVDGQPPLDALAVRAAGAIGRAIRRHGIGGSIGMDFPTLSGRAQRQAVDEAVDRAVPQPFERTAMNGFGFLQLVRRRERASLPELVRADPVGAAARAALRMAERVQPPFPDTYIVSEPVARRINARPDWLDELARRTGRRAAFVAEKH